MIFQLIFKIKILFQIWLEEKKKDSVETLNELEGDFSAALFHRGRIILS